MQSANSLSLFAILLVLIVGISHVHAVEPFYGHTCLKTHFTAFFAKLENAVAQNWTTGTSKKLYQQFSEECMEKKTIGEFRELTNQKIDVIVPEVIKYRFINDLGLAIVNLCGDINKDEDCKNTSFRHNIAAVIGDKLRTIFMNLSGRSVNAYERNCENAIPIPINPQ